MAFPPSGKTDGRWARSLDQPTPETLALLPVPGEALSQHSYPWQSLVVCCYGTHKLPSPGPGEGWGQDLRTRKPYPQNQCVPWQHIIARSFSAADQSVKSEFQSGVTSHAVGI